MTVVMGDLAGNMATDTHPLPNDEPTGKAIIIYDPGLSGGAKDVANRIGFALQDSDYVVLVAGVKSQAANNLTGYDIVVVGGPIYAGKPASSIQAYLNSFNPSEQAKVGVFGYGGVQIDNNDKTAVLNDVAGGNIDVTAAMKIVSSGNQTEQCYTFVANLLK